MNVHTYTPMDAVSYADRQTDRQTLYRYPVSPRAGGRGKESELSSFMFPAGWEALAVGVYQGRRSEQTEVEPYYLATKR